MTIATLHRLTGSVAISAALLIPAAAQAQRAEGSFERTLTVAGRPDVEIESGSGSIEVRQGAAGRVEVRGRIRATDWGWRRGRYSAEERVKSLEANPPVTQTGNVVRIGRIADEIFATACRSASRSSCRRRRSCDRRPARDRSASKASKAASTRAAARLDRRAPLRRPGQGQHGIR